MPELPTVPPLPGGEREKIPLSAINQYLFCPRRAALIHIEGIFTDNQHTLRGDIVHEHADLAGYEVAKGVTLLRALPVWSERLGLNGKCDIVEQHPLTPSLSPSDGERVVEDRERGGSTLFPVEFKLGKRRQWENDDAQLCAQALCLEEMFGVAVPRGAIFHADSKRRREVEFTPDLRAKTEAAIRALHTLSASFGERSGERDRAARLPPAVYKDACEECSLYATCLPKATGDAARAARLAKQLFQT